MSHQAIGADDRKQIITALKMLTNGLQEMMTTVKDLVHSLEQHPTTTASRTPAASESAALLGEPQFAQALKDIVAQAFVEHAANAKVGAGANKKSSESEMHASPTLAPSAPAPVEVAQHHLEQRSVDTQDHRNPHTAIATSATTTGTPTEPEKKKQRAKKRKNPDEPKGPKSSYLFYLTEQRSRARDLSNEDTETMSSQEFVSKVGAQWSALSDEQKKPYNDMAAKDKAVYEQAMREYYETHPEALAAHEAKKSVSNASKKQKAHAVAAVEDAPSSSVSEAPSQAPTRSFSTIKLIDTSSSSSDQDDDRNESDDEDVSPPREEVIPVVLTASQSSASDKTPKVQKNSAAMATQLPTTPVLSNVDSSHFDKSDSSLHASTGASATAPSKVKTKKPKHANKENETPRPAPALISHSTPATPAGPNDMPKKKKKSKFTGTPTPLNTSVGTEH